MECSLPASSARGIFHGRILEWVAVTSARGSSPRRDQTFVSYVSCIVASGFSITSAIWEANLIGSLCAILLPQSLLKAGFALEESFGHLELRVHGAHTAPVLPLLLGTGVCKAPWSFGSSQISPVSISKSICGHLGALQLSEDPPALLLTPCDLCHP